MLAGVEVPIVIVGFGNAADIVKCLTAIATQRGCPKIGVFICENGGADAFDALIGAISTPGGPCVGEGEKLDLAGPDFVRVRRLRLVRAQVPITLAQARDNLGFAGGVNAWIRRLLSETGWSGVWMLNPDTWPEPDALAELVNFAVKRRKGMVSSRIMFPDRTDIASSRGLKWRKLAASVKGVDIFAPVSPAPDPDDVERRIDSPTAVSIYVTRACIDKIGLMDEFLLPLLRRFRLGCSRQGRLRDWLRAQFGGSAYRRQIDWRGAQAGPTIARSRLSEEPQSASLRAPASPGLVCVDRFRVLPEDRRIPGGRIDAQLCRGAKRPCRRPARRKRAAGDGPQAGRRLNRNDTRGSPPVNRVRSRRLPAE